MRHHKSSKATVPLLFLLAGAVSLPFHSRLHRVKP